MKLYFLRHGIATDRSDPSFKDDSLRPLTAEGQKRMHHEALGMQALGLPFDAILSSPYVRAKQTAEIIVQIYKLKSNAVHYTYNLLPPATIEELLREVHARFPKSKNILLVGHEPHLTQMISFLLKSTAPLDIDLKKGGLCCLNTARTSQGITARLVWLLAPKQLQKIKPV